MIQKMEIDELIQLCKYKDEQAQMEVYRRYHKAMYHSALRIVQDRVDAEDVMQDGFLTAFEKLDQYKGDNKFGGWLKQITLRKALHFLEKEQKTKRFLTHHKNQLTENSLLEEEQNPRLKLLKRALDDMKPRYRHVIVLMYFEGLDYTEISTVLKISYGNCRTLISRATNSSAFRSP